MDDSSFVFSRSINDALDVALSDTPVVCLLGPRQCGKTTLARLIAQKNRAYFSLDEANYYTVAKTDPDGFIDSLPDYVTIDEVQRVPELLSSIKRTVDRDRRPGRFLLTGSANLLMLPRLTESLAGRMEIIQLYPLTESEKERNPGKFLHNVLENKFKPILVGDQGNRPSDLPKRLIAGGYPEPLKRSQSRAKQWYRNYLKALIERDVQSIDRVKDVTELSRLLELMALRTGELLNLSNLAQQLDLHRSTVDHYITILERLFLLRRLPAWHKNESKRLIKSPKVHVIDTGVIATLADLKAEDWLHNRHKMGHLLESFAVQQLIAQASWTDPDIRFWHYRDKDQVEVDIVISKGQKTWGIEVKASATVDHNDAKGLKKLAEHSGSHFQMGLLLYAGSDILMLQNPNIIAVPLKLLWEL